MQRVLEKTDGAGADRHNAWVKALRWEYNDRISRASDCSECSWAEGTYEEEMLSNSDAAHESSAIVQPLSRLDLGSKQQRFDAIDVAEASGGGLHLHVPQGPAKSPAPYLPTAGQRHSAGPYPTHSLSAVELVQAQWLAQRPPLLTRQSAPLARGER